VTRPCRAAAIGHGIARAMHAQIEDPQTPADWIQFALDAAREAESIARESMEPNEGSALKLLRELSPEEDFGPVSFSDADERAIREAGSMAFRACMPQLTCRRNVQAYIACCAAGVAHKYLTAADAKALMYSAQLALTAFPKRRASAARRAK
jgi:hypothetical protein